MGMNPNELAALPEALWEKHKVPTSELTDAVYRGSFFAALREYGAAVSAAVRKRDAEICHGRSKEFHDEAETAGKRGLDFVRDVYSARALEAEFCAAAIEREPI